MNEFDYLHSIGTCNVDKIEGTCNNARLERTCGVEHSKYLRSPWKTNDIKIFEDYKRTWYNENKITEHKGENDMSLVVMACVDEGIIAVADSKSTYFINNDGQKEKEREAKKIFKTDNLIITTFGCNMVNGEKLEDILESLLNNYDFISENEFLEQFKNILNDKKCYSTFSFIIGSKMLNSKIYYAKGYCVNQNRYWWDEGYASNNSGSTFLKNKTTVDLLNFNFPPSLKLEEVENILIDIMKMTIKIGDKVLRYNPVGGNIQTIKFQK